MTDLVTLDETKIYLNVVGDHDDVTIATLIAAASDAVRDMADDWDGEGEVPDRIKLAVLARVAITYDNRESVEGAKGELSFLLPLRALQV